MPPADLYAFWQRTREALQQTPLQAKLAEAPEQSGREYVTSLVRLDGFGGKRLRAWYTVPKDPRRAAGCPPCWPSPATAAISPSPPSWP
jgi:cephalosporin-C deacetylase-like acetyl esterase